MKVYMFYIHDVELNSSKYPGLDIDNIVQEGFTTISLYAFTPMKKCRDYFVATRDMSIFYEKIIDIDKEDYNEFCDDNLNTLLEIHEMATSCIVNDKLYINHIPVLCTLLESDAILYYKNDYIESKLTEIFNSPYIFEGLKYLKSEIREILDDKFSLKIFEEQLDIPIENFEIPYKYTIDEVGLYSNIFKNTFSKKGKVTNESLEILYKM